MHERALSTRELNRALLARQLLLERSRGTLTAALERVAGLQMQYAPSAYIGLWSRLDGFGLSDLTRALERKRAVQATLMRSTIHAVSARDYWPFARGVARSREDHWVRTHRTQARGVPDLDSVRGELRRELAGRSWHRAELEKLLESHGSTFWQGVWIDLVRVPPSGTWERRRADLFTLAEEWLGPSDVGEQVGLQHLLRRYLGGFGPAMLAEAANWAGVAAGKLEPFVETLHVRRFRTEDGKVLLDLQRAPLPPPATLAPVRFLPTWDATLLVHARRTQILPERFRPLVFNTKMPQSISTFLVDGSVSGRWFVERLRKRATLVVEPFEGLPRGAAGDLREEAARLIRFVEPDAASHAVKIRR
jgi:winged helix DNA-binding protein